MAVPLLWGMRRVPHLTRVGPLPDAECPRVSILVAARDEATGLPQALAALLAQDYSDYEIIVINDREESYWWSALTWNVAMHNLMTIKEKPCS